MRVHQFQVVQGEEVLEKDWDGDGQLTIGRLKRNGIVLVVNGVSRVHCGIRIVEGACQITDMGSANGTLVNGVLVEVADLQPGDTIKVGEATIIFEPNNLHSLEPVETAPPKEADENGPIKQFPSVQDPVREPVPAAPVPTSSLAAAAAGPKHVRKSPPTGRSSSALLWLFLFAMAGGLTFFIIQNKTGQSSPIIPRTSNSNDPVNREPHPTPLVEPNPSNGSSKAPDPEPGDGRWSSTIRDKIGAYQKRKRYDKALALIDTVLDVQGAPDKMAWERLRKTVLNDIYRDRVEVEKRVQKLMKASRPTDALIAMYRALPRWEGSSSYQRGRERIRGIEATLRKNSKMNSSGKPPISRNPPTVENSSPPASGIQVILNAAAARIIDLDTDGFEKVMAKSLSLPLAHEELLRLHWLQKEVQLLGDLMTVVGNFISLPHGGPTPLKMADGRFGQIIRMSGKGVVIEVESQSGKSSRFPKQWDSLTVAEKIQALDGPRFNDQRVLSVAFYANQAGDDAAMHKILVRIWRTRKDLRSRVHAYYSALTGIPVPKNGFAVRNGRLVPRK